MGRSLAVGLLFAGVVGGAFAILATQEVAERSAWLEARDVDGVWIDAGITQAQVSALRQPGERGGVPPEVVHPPDGAVYPAGFPSPRIQWSDAYASRVYHVQVMSGAEVLWDGVTRKREVIPPLAAWDQMKAAQKLTLRVASAGMDLDGSVAGQVSEFAESDITIAPDADNPQGMILFGAKHRPPSQPNGPVPLIMMNLRIDGMDMESLTHRVMFRSSYGPQKTQIHPGRMEEERGGGPGPGGPGQQQAPNDEHHRPPGTPQNGPDGGDERHGGPEDGGGEDDGTTHTQCVSCHAMSGSGKYIAIFSQTAEEAPPEFDAPNGFVTILTMPERKVLIQLPHAFMPQFNPVVPELVAFGQIDETIGNKDQMIVRKSDIHVLDLRTLKFKPVPGADTPDRVENFPYWSPDGKRIVFIRTKPNEMWHGSAGLIDIASVAYNDGAGAAAVPLLGASENGRSNVLPVYSPGGKWIIFTQTDQGFFSQESADLYAVPAGGGEARKMACNSRLTESWHRFGPTGKWLAVVTNREDIRRPHIYLARFDEETGTCKPAVQIPYVSGPGAHTHAFSWTKTFPWFADYEPANERKR